MAAVLAGLLIVSFVLLKTNEPKTNDSVVELTVHCAAGLSDPVSEIAKQYEKEYGVKIRLNFGGSGALKGQLQIAGGDLYLPADASYVDMTREEGLALEGIPVAKLTAGIIVPKGNPKGIKSLGDLTRDDISVALAEKSAAVGKFTQKVLRSAEVLEGIKKGDFSTHPTVNEVAELVSVGSRDAGIVWESVAKLAKECDFIPVDAFKAKKKTATITLLKSSEQVTRALRFARYLTSRDKGGEVFRKFGFETAKSDSWSETPEVVLYSGVTLRPAIQGQLKRFEQREGCIVHVKHAGYGELVSMMDAGSTPEAYFACDETFLDIVSERYENGKVISGNEVVLLVPKGNPKGLKSLEDLSKQLLKIGVSDPKKSALGALTERMLKNAGELSKLNQSGNVAVLVAKGDDMVNQLQAGTLDAGLLYRSNAMASDKIMKHCEIIKFNLQDAYTLQPYAVAKEAKNGQLLARLREFLSNESGKESFLKYGFFWKKEGE